jgi:hypothetical protein
MTELSVCEGCGRHVRASESRCPFCDHGAGPSFASGARSAAAVFFAVAAAATVAACYGGPRRMENAPSTAPTQQTQGTPAVPAVVQPADGGVSSREDGVGDVLGEARMLADRTVEIELGVSGSAGRGGVGEGLFRYTVDHPEYERVLGYVSGLAVGEARVLRG